MGLLALTSTVGTAVFGYLYPSYATYKAISTAQQTATLQPEVELWAFYWAIIGVLGAFEQTLEWFIDWVPLYYEAKFIFILWLVSPGTQGSTYLYKTYVAPFYTSNTQAIDHMIASAQTNALGFVKSAIQSIFAFIASRFQQAQAQAAQGQGPAPGQAGNPAQNNLTQAISGAFTQYLPAMLSAGASMLSPAQNKQAARQATQQAGFPDPANAPPPLNRSSPSNTAASAFNSAMANGDLRYRGSPAPTPGGFAGAPAPAGYDAGGAPPTFPEPQHQ